jgi:hypothetical protein
MLILPISVWLIDGHKWSWNSINSGIPSDTRPVQETHEKWRAAQAILAIATEVLVRLLPTIAYLTPTYEPMVRAVLVGCSALAVRVPSGSKSAKCNRTRSLEDAA